MEEYDWLALAEASKTFIPLVQEASLIIRDCSFVSKPS
jgi:hypothetical protein